MQVKLMANLCLMRAGASFVELEDLVAKVKNLQIFKAKIQTFLAFLLDPIEVALIKYPILTYPNTFISPNMKKMRHTHLSRLSNECTRA